MPRNNILEYLKRRIEELEMTIAGTEEQLRSDAQRILAFQTGTKEGRKALAAQKRELAAYRKVLKDSEPLEEEKA